MKNTESDEIVTAPVAVGRTLAVETPAGFRTATTTNGFERVSPAVALINNRYVVLVSLLVALGGFLMGFDAVVISGAVRFLELQFDLTKLQLGWAVSSLTLTATLAMMISGPLSDRIGRRKLLLASALVYAVSAVLCGFAPNFWVLVVGRLMAGLGVGATLIIAPMYIAELSPPAIRGRLVSFNQLNIVIGLSAAFFSNYIILKLGDSSASWAHSLKFAEYNWRWMLGIEAVPAAFYFFALLFVPESPRWLVLNGREDEGLAVMTKASGPESARAEIQAVKSSVHSEVKKNKIPVAALFKPALRFVLLIGISIAILQQITGINSVFFYAPMIFEQSGIGTDAAFSQAIWIGLTNLVFTVVAIFLIDRIGRRPLLIIGVSGIVLCMFLLAYGFSTASYSLTEKSVAALPTAVDKTLLQPLVGKNYVNDVQFKSAVIQALGEKTANQFESNLIVSAIHMNPKLILFGIIGFVAAFAISLGPVMWVMFSELFPNYVRGLAISVAGFINSAVSFSVQFVFPWELAKLGSATTFLIYGAFAAVGLVIVLLYVPETKGKSLEELEKILVRSK